MYNKKPFKMEVKAYLLSQYKSKTGASYYREWQLFENYLNELELPINACVQTSILDYIENLQKQSLSKVSINKKLMIIEKVYTYLLPKQPNPVSGLRLKRAKKKALLAPITYLLLSQYLSDFKANTVVQKRNRLMLSLIHHQGLRTSDLKALKLEHLKLEKAQIFIPTTRRSNARMLDLTALQVFWFSQYLSKDRASLPNASRRNLFLGSGGSKSLNGSLDKLKKLVKKGVPSLKNLEHWRSSVIVHWLESQSLLTVQAKLGHRYASSTERYQIYAIKSLQESLKKHHPLG